MSSQPSLGRVDSMDQFRGFTVLSMFIVNFVHHMDALHPFWKHNDNYVTFADWIMPGFIFAVGFSYRLTVLKRLEQMGSWNTYSTYFRRSLALVLLSLMMYGWGGEFKQWQDFTAEASIKITNAAGELEDSTVNATVSFFMRLLKSNLWEVLAIIGVAQIFIMPVIARSSLVRFVALIGCLIGHVAISGLFNWDFVHGIQDSWMVQLWHTGSNRSWDGGFFGIISWSVAMLAGSLVYDVLATNSRGQAGVKTFAIAAVMMLIGYVLSCGSRLYDVPLDQASVPKYAENPMMPDFSKADGRNWKDLLAEPPFIMPPHPDQKTYSDDAARIDTLQSELDAELKAITDEKRELTKEEQKALDKRVKDVEKIHAKLLGAPLYDHARQWNYWMMYKRMVSAPFILFATGFAIALFALFIVASDIGKLHVGVFRTFGLNPLAAYVLHSMIGHSLEAFTPENAPRIYCWFITVVFIGITYLFVRHLEKQKVFIRL